MLKIPVLTGVIARRMLVNYNVDPAALAAILPQPFAPKLVRGRGIAGICLIRLEELRPRGLPGFVGFRSENAAHRVAVQWREGGTLRDGVYIPRRDTASRFNALVGGRVFPGYHSHAHFDVSEHDGAYHVALRSDDGQTRVQVDAKLAEGLPATSVFGSVAEASAFFEQGCVGYSPGEQPGEYQGLELRAINWQVQPLAVSRVASSFFGDTTLFPPGACQFDCALLMTGIRHEWHTGDTICATPLAARG